MTSSIDLWHVTSWRRRYNLAGIIVITPLVERSD